MTNFEAYQMQPLPNEQAMQLARDLHPDAEDLLHFILKESHCIPGLIATTKVLDREFLFAADAIIKAGTQRNSMYNFIIGCKTPTTVYNESTESAEPLPAVQYNTEYYVLHDIYFTPHQWYIA